MPVMHVVFHNLLKCTGCMTTIEQALYSAGAKHFEYDMVSKIGKIVFENEDASEVKLVDSIKKVGFDLDVIEMNEDEIN
jgi:copper chaperone CopZ